MLCVLFYVEPLIDILYLRVSFLFNRRGVSLDVVCVVLESLIDILYLKVLFGLVIANYDMQNSIVLGMWQTVK
jgi:hypothetical protein